MTLRQSGMGGAAPTALVVCRLDPPAGLRYGRPLRRPSGRLLRVTIRHAFPRRAGRRMPTSHPIKAEKTAPAWASPGKQACRQSACPPNASRPRVRSIAPPRNGVCHGGLACRRRARADGGGAASAPDPLCHSLAPRVIGRVAAAPVGVRSDEGCGAVGLTHACVWGARRAPFFFFLSYPPARPGGGPLVVCAAVAASGLAPVAQPASTGARWVDQSGQRSAVGPAARGLPPERISRVGCAPLMATGPKGAPARGRHGSGAVACNLYTARRVRFKTSRGFSRWGCSLTCMIRNKSLLFLVGSVR